MGINSWFINQRSHHWGAPSCRMFHQKNIQLLGYPHWKPHFLYPICEPWCWYIYLHDWVIYGVNVGIQIPYMEHMGYCMGMRVSGMFYWCRHLYRFGLGVAGIWSGVLIFGGHSQANLVGNPLKWGCFFDGKILLLNISPMDQQGGIDILW